MQTKPWKWCTAHDSYAFSDLSFCQYSYLNELPTEECRLVPLGVIVWTEEEKKAFKIGGKDERK